MKKLLVLAFTGLVAIANAQDNSDQPYLTKPLDNASLNKIRLETSGGNIAVGGVDSDAKLEVYVRNNNGRASTLSKADLKAKLESEYELTIEVSNGQLTAIAKRRDKMQNWRNTLNVTFIVYVPKIVSSNLRTSGGNITLKNLTTGSQDFRTSGGNLVIENTGGHLDGSTSGGNISVINAKNDVDLSTSGGNIKAEDCKGDMKLTTSGGNLKLVRLEGNVHATTSGGDVDGDIITGDLSASTSGGNISLTNIAGSLETSTSGGNIRVEISTLGKFVKIHNSGGDIDLVVPSGKGLTVDLRADRIKTSTLENFRGDVDDHRYKGTLNGGGVPVEVHAGSGRISFSMK